MDLHEFRRSLKSLIGAYALPQHVILDTIEASLARALTTRYPDDEIRVALNEETLELRIVGYSGPYLTNIRQIPEEHLSGIKNLHTHIINGLAAAEVRELHRRYKRYVHQIRAGTVTRILPGGAMAVDICLEPNQKEPVTGICQPYNIATHERGTILPGDIRVFHIRRCSAVLVKGVPRLQLDLDRKSKTIPQLMLKALLFPSNPKIRVTCRERKCGTLSELWTNAPVPREYRQAVEKELREKLFIVWGATPQEVRENEKRIKARHKGSKKAPAKTRPLETLLP